jgi:hypothetical protein
MSKADSRLPCTAEGAFVSRPVYLRSVREVAMGQVFLGVLPSYPVRIIPPMFHNRHLCTRFLLEGQTDEIMRWI